MKKFDFIFIIFSPFLLTGCNTKSPVTNEFENFMREVLDTVPVNGAAYLLVPGNQCKNCVMLDANKLSDAVNNSIHVISSLKQKHFKNFRHYLPDKDDLLLELKLVDYENKLLLYDHNQVMVVVDVTVSPYTNKEIISCEND